MGKEKDPYIIYKAEDEPDIPEHIKKLKRGDEVVIENHYQNIRKTTFLGVGTNRLSGSRTHKVWYVEIKNHTFASPFVPSISKVHPSRIKGL